MRSCLDLIVNSNRMSAVRFPGHGAVWNQVSLMPAENLSHAIQTRSLCAASCESCTGPKEQLLDLVLDPTAAGDERGAVIKADVVMGLA